MMEKDKSRAWSYILLLFHILALFWWAGMFGSMLMFSSDSSFGIKGTADYYIWVSVPVLILLSIFGIKYSFSNMKELSSESLSNKAASLTFLPTFILLLYVILRSVIS
jgi:hypothetical protein